MAKAEQAPIHKYIKKVNAEGEKAITKEKAGRPAAGEEGEEQMTRFHAKIEKTELFRGSVRAHEKSDMGVAVDANRNLIAQKADDEMA